MDFIAKSLDPDAMACYEPSHQELRYLLIYFWKWTEVTELYVNIKNMCACLFQDEMDWMNFFSHTKKKSVDFGFCCIFSRE